MDIGVNRARFFVAAYEFMFMGRDRQPCILPLIRQVRIGNSITLAIYTTDVLIGVTTVLHTSSMRDRPQRDRDRSIDDGASGDAGAQVRGHKDYHRKKRAGLNKMLYWALDLSPTRQGRGRRDSG
jgi:hypothetical protein